MAVKRRFPPLHNLEGIQHNLQRVFREARRGELDVNEASKLAYILKILADMRMSADLEERLSDLEAESSKQQLRLAS